MAKLKKQSIKETTPLDNEQLKSLLHDLNSTWGVICWATHLLNEDFLSLTDYRLYQEMFERNSGRVPPILAQLATHLLDQALVTHIAELLLELEAQKSLDMLNELTLLVAKLTKLSAESSSSSR